MEPRELRDKIEAVVKETTEVERRGYLGIGDISRCPAFLYLRLTERREPGWYDVRHLREAALQRADVEGLLGMVDEVEVGTIEVEGLDGKLRGHVSGTVGADCLVVKGVGPEDFEYVRSECRARREDYEACQLYIKLGEFERAMVVYKDRVGGEFWPVVVFPNEAEQERLMAKAAEVIEAVEQRKQPRCTCGHH